MVGAAFEKNPGSRVGATIIRMNALRASVPPKNITRMSKHVLSFVVIGEVHDISR